MKATGPSALLLAVLVTPDEVSAVVELLGASGSRMSTLTGGPQVASLDESVPQPMLIRELSIDVAGRSVEVSGRRIELRRMEFDLLLHLAGDPERVFAKRDLLRQVWGYRAEGMTRTVDTHASRLRRKLGSDQTTRWVVNVRGVGYRLI